MKYRNRIAATLLVVAGLVPRGRPQVVRPRITFHLYNYAHAEQPIVQASEWTVMSLFAKIGVDTAWVDCTQVATNPDQAGACKRRVGATQVAVRILNRQMWGRLAIRGQPLGFALPYSRQERLNFIDVCFDRIEQLAAEGPASTDQILGAVVVHEVGHLFLGSHAHSVGGIMCAQWSRKELTALVEGQLTMTREQASHIRAELLAREETARSQTQTPDIRVRFPAFTKPYSPLTCLDRVRIAAVFH